LSKKLVGFASPFSYNNYFVVVDNLLGVTVVSVAHRPSVLRHHQKVTTLEPVSLCFAHHFFTKKVLNIFGDKAGGWSFESIEASGGSSR
jgi:hypothetical protein